MPLSDEAKAIQRKMGSVPDRQRQLLLEIAAQPHVYGERCPYCIPLSAADRDSPSIAALIKRKLVSHRKNFLYLTADGETMVAALAALNAPTGAVEKGEAK